MAILLNGRNKYLDPSLDYNTYADALSPAGTSQENPGLMFREPQRHAFPVAPPSVESAESPTVPHPDDIARYDAFTPSGPAASPDIERDILTPQINKAQADYSAALHAPRARMWRQILGGFVGARNPMLGGVISGELGRQRNIEAAGSDYSMALNALQQQRQAEMFGLQKQNIQSEVAGRQAEMAMLPYRLEQLKAQTAGAYLKEVPNVGLFDIRQLGQSGQGGQPGQPEQGPLPVAGNMAALEADEAAALGMGHKAGDIVPISQKDKANEMVTRGQRSIQANGRQLIVDRHGDVVRDEGVATPMTVINATMGAFGNANSPQVQALVDQVGSGTVDLPTALSTMRRNPGAAANFMGALFEKYPNFKQQQYGISKKTMDYFTTGKGAEELNAFRTAIAHAELLKQAAKELNNPNSRTLAGIRNRLKTEFGDSDLTNFKAIANAYIREVTKAVSAGHITNSEIGEQGATMPDDANPATIERVANSYQALMSSKAQQRMLQYEKGLQGEAAFPEGVTPGNTGAPGGAKTIEYKIVNGALVPKAPGEK